MHVADGILPAGFSIAADVAAVGAVYWFGRGVRSEEIARMGMMASTLFTASLVHIPVAGTSVHFGLLGLAGILLGARAFPVIFATLLMQSLLFQHGGLLSVGVNSWNMGLGALAAAALWRWLPLSTRAKSAVCTVTATMTAALLMAAEFQWAGYGKGLFWIAGVYGVVAGLEAAVTVVVVDVIYRVKPEALETA